MIEPNPIAGIVHDFDTDTEGEVHFYTPAWVALLEWLEFHGIDPTMIPGGSRITRSASGCCIRYTHLILDQAGAKKVRWNHDDEHTGCWADFETVDAIEQGEAPPLPFPDLVAELMLAGWEAQVMAAYDAEQKPGGGA